MITFSDFKSNLLEATKGKYKGVSWKLSKAGSFYSLYVDGEKVDVYKSEKEATKAAKQFIDLSK